MDIRPGDFAHHPGEEEIVWRALQPDFELPADDFAYEPVVLSDSDPEVAGLREANRAYLKAFLESVMEPRKEYVLGSQSNPLGEHFASLGIRNLELVDGEDGAGLIPIPDYGFVAAISINESPNARGRHLLRLLNASFLYANDFCTRLPGVEHPYVVMEVNGKSTVTLRENFESWWVNETSKDFMRMDRCREQAQSLAHDILLEEPSLVVEFDGTILSRNGREIVFD